MKIDKVYVDPNGEVRMSPTVPFEDEEDELDIKMLILAANKEIDVSKGLHAADIKKDEFYTIEPIHVEIVDSWGPFHENTFPDKFARIITEEEKPIQ